MFYIKRNFSTGKENQRTLQNGLPSWRTWYPKYEFVFARLLSRSFFSETIRTFSVEHVYQKVHGQLALALGSGVKTVMPAFYVVVGSNRLQEDGPTGWQPGVALNP